MLYFLDTIRTNNKFKLVPEKDIDIPISVWLSHARFRLKKQINVVTETTT